MKRGPANHKAFLSRQGKKLLARHSSHILDLMSFSGISTPETPSSSYHNTEYDKLYLFSPPQRKGKQAYSRSHFNSTFNQVLQSTPMSKENEIPYTSHSLRHGYISSLWSETKDLKFVQAVIGHMSISSTSIYADHLTDDQRQKRMEQINDFDSLNEN